MAIPELWSAARLLVPVRVEALVVNNLDQRRTQWAINPNVYIGRERLDPVAPHPFSRSRRHSRVGVTLHWGLPDALTRGSVTDSGMVFTKIPNRWLIVRLRLTANNSLLTKAWVLDSDVQHVDATNPYPKADGTLTRIGKKHDLADWTERDNPGAAYLTHEGPGDVTFAAYVAHNDNVLSFYDNLDDEAAFPDEPVGDGPERDRRELPAVFSYLVFGWYAKAQAEADPLSSWLTTEPDAALAAEQQNELLAAQMQSWLDEMRWSLGGDEGDVARAATAITDAITPATPAERYPWQMLCHGHVHGVNWNGLNGVTQSGVPEVNASATEIWAQTGPSWTTAAGDTLQKIALTMYGDTAGANRIRQANPEQIDANTPADAVLSAGVTLVIPRRKTDIPHVAIGNSSAEALAAMVEYLADRSGVVDDSSDIGALLQAAQLGLLEEFDQPGGRVALDQAVHKGWFHAQAAYTFWELAPPRREPAGMDGDGATTPFPDWSPTGEQQDELLALNQRQQALDAAQAELRAAQQRLYDLWWKSKKFDHVRKPVARLPAVDEAGFEQDLKREFNAAVTAVVNAKNMVDAAVTNFKTAKETFDAELAALPAHGRPELVQKEHPRFYKPADPVLAIFGGQRSTKHGNDGRFREDGALFCRVTGQTISQIQLAIATITPAIPTALNDLLTDKADHLPTGEIAALAREALLLDPTLVEHVAPGQKVAMDQKRELFWAKLPGKSIDEAAHSRAAGVDGLIPSPHGVVAWRAPWSPLFMSWQVTWYPTSQEPAEAHAAWEFDPLNGLEYDWTGTSLPNHKNVLTISGRSILADADLSRMTKGLQASGAAGAGAKEDLGQLSLIEDQLASADLLLQTMTGFHDQLLMRARDLGYLPNPNERHNGHNLRELMGQAIFAGAPVPFANGAFDENGEAIGHFYPLRAGHLRVNRIWVIDSFGQVFDPIFARGQTLSSFVPLRGSGLATVGGRQRGDSQVLQFPPRLLGAARLACAFQPAAADGNPICAWFLPNYHDRSLAVYDRNGRPLGTLLPIHHQNTPVLGWASADTLRPTHEAPDLADMDPTLKAVLQALFAQPDNRQAFAELGAAIDRGLWTIEPSSGRQPNRALLLGRPIALARVRLRLETDGPAARNQLWGKTFAYDAPWHTGLEFKVQLGDVMLRQDGTFGYFAADDFTIFHANMPDDARTASGYVSRQPTLLNLTLNGVDDDRQPRFTEVACLFDPNQAIYARSGILPTQVLRVDGRYLTPAAKQMEATFRVGPLLTPPDAVRMPLPAELHGSWSWIERTGVHLAPGQPIAPLSEAVVLDEPPPLVREGWLKLTNDS